MSSDMGVIGKQVKISTALGKIENNKLIGGVGSDYTRPWRPRREFCRRN